MELRRGAPCVRPHFWHGYEVTVVSRGVDGCMSVVTVTIAEAQFSQTGAGNLRAMHVIGSTDISESKQNYPRNNAKALRNVPSVESGSDREVGPRAFVCGHWNRAGNKIFVTYRNESAPASFRWQIKREETQCAEQ
jgi:hypothetical protein